MVEILEALRIELRGAGYVVSIICDLSNSSYYDGGLGFDVYHDGRAMTVIIDGDIITLSYNYFDSHDRELEVAIGKPDSIDQIMRFAREIFNG